MFSPVKEVRYGKAYNDDLLVPLMSYPHEYLVEVPPEDKVWRAVRHSPVRYGRRALGAATFTVLRIVRARKAASYSWTSLECSFRYEVQGAHDP